MVYGDLQLFDIIIFAGIAVFLIYRLRNVLGRRSGFQKKDLVNNTIQNVENIEQKNIPQLKDNEVKLSKVYEHEKGFDHKNFLEGAKFAFEAIITAYNKGDKKTLKNLLTKDVFISFEQMIDSGKNNSNLQFYSLVIDSVESVDIENNMINVTLKITSEQFTDNDENTIIKKQDVWTFQKKINSKSSIWFLSAT